jgi:hypothetical protein
MMIAEMPLKVGSISSSSRNIFEAKLARRLGVVVYIGFKPEILPNWGCKQLF